MPKCWKMWLPALASLPLLSSIVMGVTLASNDIPGGWVRRVVEAPSAAGTYYAASWNVFKSTDFGHSWQRKDYPMPVFDANDMTSYGHFPRHNTYDLAVCPADPDTIITGDQMFTPVWRSTDGANTWTSVSLVNDSLPRTVTMVSFSLTDPNTCFAAGRVNQDVHNYQGHVLYRSTDKGANWSPTGLQVSQDQTIMDVIQSTVTGNPGRVIAAVVDKYYSFVGDAVAATTGKIYVSDNNGTTFLSSMTVTLNWAPYKFTWDPTNRIIWAIGSDGAIYSSADGIDWRQRNGSQTTLGGGTSLIFYYKILYSLVESTPMIFASAFNNGMANQSVLRYKAADFPGGTWTPCHYAIGNGERIEGQVYDIIVDSRAAGGTTWGVAESVGGFRYTTDDGSTLNATKGINTREVHYGASDGTRFFASTFGNVIYASTDSAVTWARVYPPLGTGSGGGGQILITLHPTNPTKVYLCDGTRVLISTSNGQGGFDYLSSPTQYPQGGITKQLTNLLIHPSSPTVMFVGIASEHGSAAGNYLLKSVNAGTSWTPVISLTSHGIYTIAFDPANPDIIYASCGSGWGSRPFNGTADGLYRTTDGGTTWEKLGAGIFDRGYLETMAFDPLDPTIIFAGGVYSDSGHGVTDAVHVSTDTGKTWKMLMMNSNQIGTSKVFYYGSSLYFGTSEGYLYQSDTRGRTWGMAMMLPSMIEWIFDGSTSAGGSAPYLKAYRAAGTSSVLAASQSGLYRLSGIGAASGIITGGFGDPFMNGGSGGIGGADDQKAYAGGDVKLYIWPNPFNPKVGSAMIRLGLPQSATKVNLKVFTLTGDLVVDSDIAGQLQGSTYHGWLWNGRNQNGEVCAPGLYFVIADVDGKILRQKAVIKY